MIALASTPAHDTHTDPAHNIPLPKGHAIQRVLHPFLDRQRLAVADWLRTLRSIPARGPAFGAWTEQMTASLQQPVEAYQRVGAAGVWRDILRAVVNAAAAPAGGGGSPKKGAPAAPARRAISRLRTKRAASTPTVDEIIRGAFSVFNQEVADAARNASWMFCASTNATATTAVAQAIRDARESLAQGLEQGEALAVLTVRVQQHFNDPLRAARIAMTEASRATHAGQQLLAEKTDGLVTGKTWLASSDACERCLKLDGMTVPLGEHFLVEGGGGPYAVVEHPPLHPHCMCAITMEVNL